MIDHSFRDIERTALDMKFNEYCQGHAAEEGNGTWPYLPVLHQLALMEKGGPSPTIIIEIGVHAGRSTVALLAALAHSSDATLISIDIEPPKGDLVEFVDYCYPVAVTLRYPGGVMRWPRPRAMDVATGRYEFLVSPGRYWLQVDDPGAPVVQIDVDGDGERHEISFQLQGSRPLSGPAISNPWRANATPPASATPPTATPTATPVNYGHEIYLPGITKNVTGRHQTYLPIVSETD